MKLYTYWYSCNVKVFSLTLTLRLFGCSKKTNIDLFFSHVLMSMVTPLFYYCYYSHYYNQFCYYYFHYSITKITLTWMSICWVEPWNTAKLLTIFAKKFYPRCLTRIGYSVLCISPLCFRWNFWTLSPKKNLVTFIRVASLFEKNFLGYLGDFRSFSDENVGDFFG